eukprot:PhM_4_TR16491/c0_g1_i1/m.21344
MRYFCLVALIVASVAMTTVCGLNFHTSTFSGGPIHSFKYVRSPNVAVLISGGVLHGTLDGGRSWSPFVPQTKNARSVVVPPTTATSTPSYFLVVTDDGLLIASLEKLTIDGTAMDSYGGVVKTTRVTFHPTKSNAALVEINPSEPSEGCDNVDAMCPKVILISLDGCRTFSPLIKPYSVIGINQASDVPTQIYKAWWPNTDSLKTYYKQDNLVYVLHGEMSQLARTNPNLRPFIPLQYKIKTIDYTTSQARVISLYSILRPGSTHSHHWGGNFNPIEVIHIKHYTFVATTESRQHSGELALPGFKLLETNDNFAHVYMTEFPPSENSTDLSPSETGYMILDSSEGTIFINVRHSNKVPVEGNTYLSDHTGQRFDVSLENTRLSATTGEADFHKVRGLEGIYIATQVEGVKNLQCLRCKSDEECNKQCDFRTKMTWNKGASWEQLQPPLAERRSICGMQSVDASVPLSARQLAACALHLHGGATNLNEVDSLASSPEAPGIIIGNGNVGRTMHTSLDLGINTYLSRDGGETWTMVAENPHTYTMLDRGSMLLMARFDTVTDTISYSLDGGATWNTKKFVTGDNKKVDVHELTRAPGSERSRQALLIGTNEDDKGVVIVIDGTDDAHGSCDRDTDLETFVPKAYNSQCLLGRKLTYYRRRSGGALCELTAQNAALVDSPTIENCTCTDDDFQCDYNFHRVNGRCKSRYVWYSETKFCGSDGFWHEYQGYTKVSGDTCSGGSDYSQPIVTTRKCASTNNAPDDGTGDSKKKSGHGFLIFSLMLIVCIVGIAIYAIKRPDDAAAHLAQIKEAIVSRLPGRSDSTGSGGLAGSYAPVGELRVSTADDDDDEDEDNLFAGVPNNTNNNNSTIQSNNAAGDPRDALDADFSPSTNAQEMSTTAAAVDRLSQHVGTNGHANGHIGNNDNSQKQAHHGDDDFMVGFE